MINITSLTQPASPNSRRSSSISALALYNTAVTSTYTHPNNPIHNNSTVVNLYTRQYMQKKEISSMAIGQNTNSIESSLS